LLRRGLDFNTQAAELVGKRRAATGNILQQRLENQARDRVNVTGECIAAEAQRFQRNRPTPGKRINDKWGLI